MSAGDRERLDLSQAARTLVEECRMVLPGVQATFGFQLIAVFNQGFDEKLSHGEQVLHLFALVLVSTAAALIMTPAAYHRIHGSREVTARFVHISSRLLLASMIPLAVGLSLDVFLLSRIVLGNIGLAVAVATLVFSIMAFLWFVFPRVVRA